MTLLFIFDMDDVLYDYDWSVRMRALTDLTGHDLAELRRRWWHDDGEWAAEAGRFASPDDYLDAVRRALEFDIDEDEWVRIRGAAMTPFPESIDAVRRAAELGQVTLLTNNGPLISKHLRTVAPALTDVFGEHLFTSSDYGARKPEREVFERVLESYGVPASDAFFADDLAINIAGARSVGITSHLFTEPSGMRRAIEEFAAAHA
ncbi:HAD superfamily hydrolase (TIGR01509 family) [Microbacteriaceae bacterium SG_E_30_P1]|uniref:HAD superfamily hydrolase (TIGR01509 family) n=1 Tax=Antiquaquibacter oligotrophicus TaxID=2880260 RepID=A0ABT6KKK7_9MICO|nr:HAD family phosphatase [Antiquaquibacter oligotrophicus]MDH6180547.1 HAD superfamily hydrolase (TIGR01509 family) [Antiquaquibacter oligotrophicus]UDF13719.1 HAD family phosphatase [Antiquaquibacter oligotrophicus]